MSRCHRWLSAFLIFTAAANSWAAEPSPPSLDSFAVHLLFVRDAKTGKIQFVVDEEGKKVVKGCPEGLSPGYQCPDGYSQQDLKDFMSFVDAKIAHNKIYSWIMKGTTGLMALMTIPMPWVSISIGSIGFELSDLYTDETQALDFLVMKENLLKGYHFRVEPDEQSQFIEALDMALKLYVMSKDPAAPDLTPFYL